MKKKINPATSLTHLSTSQDESHDQKKRGTMSRHVTLEVSSAVVQKDEILIPTENPVSAKPATLSKGRSNRDFHATTIMFESRDEARNLAVIKARWGDGTRASTLVEPMLGVLARALAKALAEAGAAVGGGTRTLTLVLTKAGTLTNPKALTSALTDIAMLALDKIEDETTELTRNPVCLSGGGILTEGGATEPGVKLLYLPTSFTASGTPGVTPAKGDALEWAATLEWAGTLAGAGTLPKAAAKELAAELASSYLVESMNSAINHAKAQDVAAGTLLTLVVAGIVDGPEIQPGIVAIKKIATSCESKPVWTRLNAASMVTQVIKNLDDKILPNIFIDKARAKVEMVKTKALADEAEGAAMEAMSAQENTKRWYH